MNQQLQVLRYERLVEKKQKKQTAVLLWWTHINAAPFHAMKRTKTPDNSTHQKQKTSVWLLYMPAAQTPHIYKSESGPGVWNRGRKITKWSKSSAWWRWADTVLFQIDWKISGIMIKVWTRSYSALPGRTAKTNVIGEVWLKICCHGNSIEAQSLLLRFGLVLDI